MITTEEVLNSMAASLGEYLILTAVPSALDEEGVYFGCCQGHGLLKECGSQHSIWLSPWSLPVTLTESPIPTICYK